jgi:AcrR family transcriptional regulator
MEQKNNQIGAKRPRGRPRAYDGEQALSSAMQAFWRSGYSATSLDELSDATGMNRPSLYAAFGDKQALYLAALRRYADDGARLMRTVLEREPSLPMALQAVYRGALDMYYPDGENQRGCFLIGTAAVESVSDEQVRAALGDSLRDFDQAFEARFYRAQSEGELPASASPAMLARLASAVLHTLALRSRAGDSRSTLWETALAGIALLCQRSAGG